MQAKSSKSLSFKSNYRKFIANHIFQAFFKYRHFLKGTDNELNLIQTIYFSI